MSNKRKRYFSRVLEYFQYNPYDPHCGPFNKISKGEGGKRYKPLTKEDEICKAHDEGYAHLQEQGIDPYFTWNEYDEALMRDMPDTKRGYVYRQFFIVKRAILGGNYEAKETPAIVPAQGAATGIILEFIIRVNIVIKVWLTVRGIVDGVCHVSGRCIGRKERDIVSDDSLDVVSGLEDSDVDVEVLG